MAGVSLFEQVIKSSDPAQTAEKRVVQTDLLMELEGVFRDDSLFLSPVQKSPKLEKAVARYIARQGSEKHQQGTDSLLKLYQGLDVPCPFGVSSLKFSVVAAGSRAVQKMLRDYSKDEKRVILGKLLPRLADVRGESFTLSDVKAFSSLAISCQYGRLESLEALVELLPLMPDAGRRDVRRLSSAISAVSRHSSYQVERLLKDAGGFFKDFLVSLRKFGEFNMIEDLEYLGSRNTSGKTTEVSDRQFGSLKMPAVDMSAWRKSLRTFVDNPGSLSALELGTMLEETGLEPDVSKAVVNVLRAPLSENQRLLLSRLVPRQPDEGLEAVSMKGELRLAGKVAFYTLLVKSDVVLAETVKNAAEREEELLPGFTEEVLKFGGNALKEGDKELSDILRKLLEGQMSGKARLAETEFLHGLLGAYASILGLDNGGNKEAAEGGSRCKDFPLLDRLAREYALPAESCAQLEKSLANLFPEVAKKAELQQIIESYSSNSFTFMDELSNFFMKQGTAIGYVDIVGLLNNFPSEVAWGQKKNRLAKKVTEQLNSRLGTKWGCKDWEPLDTNVMLSAFLAALPSLTREQIHEVASLVMKKLKSSYGWKHEYGEEYCRDCERFVSALAGDWHKKAK